MTDQQQKAPYAETPGDPVTAEAHRAAVQKEYTQFIALGPIDHDGARAYNTGDAVPAANVERWGYLDRGLVAKRGTKAGAAVADSLAATVGDAVSAENARRALDRDSE